MNIETSSLGLQFHFMHSSANTYDLRVDTSTRQIFKIATPIALAMLIPQLNFVVNTVFLSHIGEMELGIAGITGVYYLIFALVGNGLNSGLQALISRRAGENRPEEIGRLFMQSIYIALFFAAGAILLNYIGTHYFLQLVLKSPDVLQHAIRFLNIRVWGLPFLYLFHTCNALLVGSNNSKYLKWGFIIEALANIFFDYTLIFGKLGFPQLGFNGAAYASIIAEITGLLVAAGIIWRKKFHTRFAVFKHPRINSSYCKTIFNQSLPLVLQFTISVSAWLFFYVLIEHQGPRKLAISNTMRNLFAIFGIVTWSFANTTNMMVSNIIGQGKSALVHSLTRKIATISFCIVCILCLLLNLSPATILKIYGTDDGFITEAIPVLRTITCCLLMMAIAVVWLNCVTATGNTRVNLMIEIVTVTVYCIYVYIVLSVYNLSLVMAWASEFLYWLLTFALAYGYIRRWALRQAQDKQTWVS